MDYLDKRCVEKLEEERKDALKRQDALNYFTLCQELGVKPEDKPLHEMGMLESSLMQEQEESFSLQASARGDNSRYSLFYQEGELLRVRDFARDADSKRELLARYFPGRFGEDGKQPVGRMSDVQVGSLFKRLMDYSREKILQ